MTEKSLLSLREIARELNLNYRTVIDAKNQFNEFIIAISGKYPPDYKDFFMLIYALRDEGYDTQNIKALLRGELEQIPDMDGWVEEWIKKIKQLTMGWTDGCLDGCEDGRMEGRMDTRPDGQINVQADEEMDVRTDEQMDGWMDRGAEGTSLTEISASLLASQIRSDILAHLHPTLSHLQAQLADLAASLPGDLVPQINAALTQFYKFAMELSARLERLEKELGLELQPMETELDLQSMQIDQDEPMESYVHADLEFVRASVFEGKPDKESVRQWLQRQRQENPGQSYAALAEILNIAGIPTLSGRDTWNRGTLRNLLTER